MKKLSLIVILIMAIGYMSFTLIQKSTWTYDRNHAKVGFSVTHMMISDVEGYFKTANATLTTSKEDFSDAVVEMTADASSIFTDNENRDAHLRTADFFDVEKFPTITFKSFYFKKAKKPNTYYVKGNLTMHGVTKPVGLDVVARMGVNPMNKKTIAGFKITGTLA
jgi:polyisoprenoid-binding protein YceI